MSLFVGVDVGGTTSTIAIGDSQHRVLCISDQFATRSIDGPDATIADIVAQIKQQLHQLGRSEDEVSSITLATPGPATLDGVLLSTPNLDSRLWNKCPIRQRLEIAWACDGIAVPVRYIGDGQAAAVGESAIRTGLIHWDDSPMQGKADHFDSLFMVAVGTGLGGGEVRNGIPVQGSQGRAGHAGHLMLPVHAFRYEHDRNLKVGNAYCTSESAISLTALTHQLSYRLTLDQYKAHPLNRQTCSMKDKAKQLRELAADGDPLAVELLDDQARALGITMLMVNYLGDFDRLVIGGGVCDMIDPLKQRYLELVQTEYYDNALDGFRNFDQFSFSVCGDQASVIGALAHAMGK
ncbi:Glucokinase [Rubripirellula lacrimiformis]|uniref:Glucokinase n=1 Tax=Rubripirellula lacrimiformis TaxID=1930273 RepID=A0A517NEJ4_9BACT|nr:ROK family protein [Rubripirellula lacrimiformis]QDT05551.1 Glucokinase [Rubripirellula lacrimiformis]